MSPHYHVHIITPTFKQSWINQVEAWFLSSPERLMLVAGAAFIHTSVKQIIPQSIQLLERRDRRPKLSTA